MSINTTVLMGRICHDLEIKTTTNGVSVLRFRLAVERAYTPKGEEKKTDFIDCVAWRNTAEFVDRYFKKGSMIAVVGSIQTGEFIDKDGNKRRTAEVVADNVYFGESKRSEQQGNGYSAPASYGNNGYSAPAPNYGGFSAPAAPSYGSYSAPAASSPVSDFAMPAYIPQYLYEVLLRIQDLFLL